MLSFGKSVTCSKVSAAKGLEGTGRDGTDGTDCAAGDPRPLGQDSDYRMAVDIPQGASKRQAMNIVHHAVATFIRQVNVEAQEAHLEGLQKICSKRVYMEACSNLKFKKADWPDLGFEDVECPQVDATKAEKKALEIYGKTVDRVRKKVADDEQKKKDDDKKKEETAKKLEGEKPSNLLVDVVRKVVKEEHGEGDEDLEKAADAFTNTVRGKISPASPAKPAAIGTPQGKEPKGGKAKGMKGKSDAGKGGKKGKFGKNGSGGPGKGPDPKNGHSPGAGRGVGKRGTAKDGQKGKGRGGKSGKRV